jgi:hypothetical protein
MLLRGERGKKIENEKGDNVKEKGGKRKYMGKTELERVKHMQKGQK